MCVCVGGGGGGAGGRGHGREGTFLTLCTLGNFACFFVFSQNQPFFENSFSECHQSVKQFGPRSGTQQTDRTGPTFCGA